MGKRRVQTRQQVRKIQPKPQKAGSAPASGATRRQRERFVEAGGMLQGYSPEFVQRLGYIAIGIAAGCLIVIAALLIFLPRAYGWPDAIAASIAWLLPIALLASFVGPGFRLAMKDRKAEPRLVQGQLKGAASVSTSRGLGMLMIQTRSGDEQYLVPPARLKQVPGNQVSVVLTVTPNLRHVRSVGVMGQRMVGRVEPPVPAIMRRVQLVPLLTPVALAVAAIAGDDAVALSPISPSLLHAALAVVGGAILGGAVYLGSTLLQRRMMAEVQALVPKG
ncbi:MAG TPA: hypothetical protein VND96_03200 [Candidatus Micrarchaeaceae archaeon]|nr:hypothetical protein [Candidatus Micrarchaeaceae archaeon]